MGKRKHRTRWLNEPFDSRILRIGGKDTANGKHKLTRGRLVDPDNGNAIRFLFNPISIDVSHALDPDLVGSAGTKQKGAPDTQKGQIVGIGNIRVPLLYDRTYELWGPKHPNSWAAQYGMYADVLAYYHFLGITETIETTKMLPNTGARKAVGPAMRKETWQGLYPSKAMAGDVMAYLYIGDKLKYYGQVDSFSVTYSHFTYDMIPMRGAVVLTMLLQEDPKAQKARAGVRRDSAIVAVNQGPKGKHRESYLGWEAPGPEDWPPGWKPGWRQ